MDNPEIVIVGGGIGGSGLATALARQGTSVAVLERDRYPIDRVRGEVMVPWGVTEADALGILDILRIGARGIYVPRIINYDEVITPEQAETNARDSRSAHALGVGSLCASHPLTCQVLGETAATAGAVFLRGVTDIMVTAGNRPQISFRSDGKLTSWRPRLVVGADGRTSTVRRQLKFPLLHDEPRFLIGGMLVGGVPEWPSDTWEAGPEGDLHHLVFPQGDNKVRLYVAYSFVGRERFTGADRERNLLAAFNLKCMPLGAHVARGVPIGPFHSFSNEDHWVERPVAPGVVLIGDAAGYNDPLTGQGLSITLRDVRIVRDILLAGDWRPSAFEPYVEERRERMRRLRISARFAADLRVEFGPEAASRRARALERIRAGWLSPLGAGLFGPDKLPPEAFEQGTIDALLAGPQRNN